MRARLLLAAVVAASGCNDNPAPSEAPVAAPAADPTPSEHEPAVATPSEPSSPQAAPASTPVPPQAFVPKSPADYVGKHVLLPSGAKLRVAPDDEAASATLHLRAAAADAVPATRTMEVVGHDGEFIAVRNPLAEHGCTPAMPGLASFDLKLWIHPHEVAPVLGLRTTVRAGDDAAVLWPGAPVMRNGTDTTVDVGGLQLAVAVDPGVITTAFVPQAAPTIAADASAVGPGAALSYDGQTLDESKLLGATTHRTAATVRAKAGERTATTWARCAELTVALDASRPTDPWTETKAGLYAMKGPSVLGYPSRDTTTYSVAKGAEVFLRDGTTLGAVSDTYEFLSKPRKAKARQCFKLALFEKGPTKKPAPKDSRLELCFDPSAVTENLSVHEMMLSAGILGSLSSGSALGTAGVFGSTEDPFGDLDSALMGSAIGEEFGAGGLGLSGTGRGGGGTGEGTIGLGSVSTIGSGSGEPVPKVRLGKSVTASGLDKDVARRIVRAHISEVRACYRKGLEVKEGASGTLTFELSVNAAGKVTSTGAIGDTIAKGVVGCIAKKATKWRFPKPTGSATIEFSLTFTAV